MKDETLSIHFGYETDPTTKSVATPIYQTVAYEFDDVQHGADSVLQPFLRCRAISTLV